MCPWKQRLLLLWCACGLRNPSELHGAAGLGGVYVQRGPGLQRCWQCVCKLDDACHVREGRAGLRVRVGDFDVRPRCL